jgi:tetratricopeptide (TPR) repeat protein
MKPRHALLAACIFLAACGSVPSTPESALRERALQNEQDAARCHARGEFALASQHFGEAARLFASIDDNAGAARNTLNQVRTELAAGQAMAALNRLDRMQAEDDPALSIETAQLHAQAYLALGQSPAAAAALESAFEQCSGRCPGIASLHVLAARLDLAENRPQQALAHATSALQALQNQNQAPETANAWRLTATAQLALNHPGAALIAAQAALDIDRRLALPEKLARDWLLIGDIRRAQKVGAGTTAKRPENSPMDAATAYRRALGIALAAGLDALAERARQALATIQSDTP